MRTRHQQLVIARGYQMEHRIPKADLEAYSNQFYACLRRGIELRFTLPEWYEWWSVDNRWANRGLHPGGLVMARKGDEGHYEIGNVYCATVSENAQDRAAKHSVKMLASYERRKLNPSWKSHLAERGDCHPKSRAVITPDGRRFGSATLAAEAFGIGARAAQQRAQKGIFGWRFESAPRGASTKKHREAKERSTAIITPKVRFECASEAALAFGIMRQHATRLARHRLQGWRYELDDLGRPTG